MDSTMDKGTILVEIDSELEPVIPSFLENRIKDCVLLERLLEEGGLKEIERLGHRLKGAGGSYGFDAISDIGEALEHAAAAHDRSSIILASRQLQQYLERVTVVYV